MLSTLLLIFSVPQRLKDLALSGSLSFLCFYHLCVLVNAVVRAIRVIACALVSFFLMYNTVE